VARGSAYIVTRWLCLAVLAGTGPACGRQDSSSSAPSCPPPSRPTTIVSAPSGVVPCPTAEQLALVDSDVSIAFEGEVGAGTYVCRAVDGSRDLTQVQKNVYQTLLFMRSVQFDAPLPWTSSSLYGWFTSNVRGVRIRTDIIYDSCCQPASVISLLGTRIIEATIPSYLEIMVHEARHIDHVSHQCENKDNTISELGAFGVQYYVLVWMSAHWPAAGQAEREYVQNRAEWLRASAFCRECQ
jgi:hypothetical protein